MRVPEISLGYGLLAQNKHDLCRYYKYTERHKQTQYLPAYTVSFMVVPSVRAWEFRGISQRKLMRYSDTGKKKERIFRIRGQKKLLLRQLYRKEGKT